MKKATKIILIVSASCMGAGMVLAAAGIAVGGWPGFSFSRQGIRSASVQPEPYELKKDISDPFSNIRIRLSGEADIRILPSDDEHCYLEYVLDGNYDTPELTVTNDTLTLTQTGGSIHGVYFFGPGIDPDNTDPYVRLYLPAGMSLSDIEIYNDYGNLDMEQVTCDSLSAELSYGDLSMDTVSASALSCYLDYGDLDIQDCTFTDSLTLVNDYGDSSLKNTAVRSADLTVNSGDLYLEAAGLETLEGVNEYGDTTLVLNDDISGYSFDLMTEYGTITIPEGAQGKLSSDDIGEMSWETTAAGNKKIQFTAEAGDIKLQIAAK